MKIYISVDIEGVTGVSSWNETLIDHPEYIRAREQMNKEALAAVRGAIRGGAREIYLKDAHDTARNLDIGVFPDQVKLIRGWTGDPFSMLGLLDESFDGVVYIGYHAGAGQEGNPLSHTINNSKVSKIKVNGEIASEFSLNNLRAMDLNVGSIFLSGDKEICQQAKQLVPSIETVAVKESRGGATLNLGGKLAIKKIEQGVERAVRKIGSRVNLRGKLADYFDLEISYRDHTDLVRALHYPGVKKLDSHTIYYRARSVMELMTVRMFIM